MPVREKAQVESKAYDYDTLLTNIREYIDENYGGVAKFLESEKFTAIGFEDTKSERAKFHTYLAHQNKKANTVKSFPVLKKLYKGLLGIELSSKIVRTQIITSNKNID